MMLRLFLRPAKPLDQLYLPRMINRVAGDAECQVESLGGRERRLRLACLEVGDDRREPAVLRLHCSLNVRPLQRCFIR